MLSFLLFVIGLVFLIVGGELSVMGAIRVAEKFRVHPLVIGIVLIGFSTSLPEFFTGIAAIQNDAVGITLGNVAGSNVANILLVVGLTAFLIPFSCREERIGTVTIVMLLVTGWFGVLLWLDIFSRLTGAFMISVLALYILYILYQESREAVENPINSNEFEKELPPFMEFSNWVYLRTAFGLLLLWGGAELIVHHGVLIASMLSVPESVIGLTALAVGTSLPEIATCIISARRGFSDIALGNVLGSNIFNILFVLGAAALIHPFSVSTIELNSQATESAPISVLQADSQIPPAILHTHVDWMFISIAIFVVVAFWRQQFSRRTGAVMLGTYLFLYLGSVFGWFPSVLGSVYG